MVLIFPASASLPLVAVPYLFIHLVIALTNPFVLAYAANIFIVTKPQAGRLRQPDGQHSYLGFPT